MKNILHLPAWYPTDEDPIAGSYIKSYIDSIASLDFSYRHFVWLYHQNTVQLNLNNLFDIFKSPVSSWNQKNSSIKSVEYIYSDKIVSLSPKIGGNWIRQVSVNLKNKLRELNLRPDLLHVHVSFPGLAMAKIIKENYHSPILVTEHSSRFPDDRYGVYNYNLNQLLYIANKKVAVSNFLKLRFPSNSVDIIPNFIDIPVLEKKAKNPFFTFLVVTRLDDERKRLDLVLMALQKVIAINKSIRLSIIGDGKKRKWYQTLANHLGILEFIEWHGILTDDNKASIISKSHCLIVASDIETFSISTIEAHSQGLPVIATKCGGVEELIDSSNGLLIEKNSVKSLEEAMLWMIENHNKFQSKSISENTYKRFDKNHILEKYLSIYQDLICNENK